MGPNVKPPIFRVGIGKESHRFLPDNSSKICVIGGVIFKNAPGLASDSDGDVAFHAICNAITSLTGVPILEGIVQELIAKDGITDSQVFIEKALETLGDQRIVHVALSFEGLRPQLQSYIEEMRLSIANVLQLKKENIGITATTGSGLTDFGCGDGIQCLCILTTEQK